MLSDVLELRNFYGTPLGVMTRRLLNEAIKRHFDGLKGMNVLGLGFATPYIGLFRHTATRSLCFMPMEQGVIHWPTSKPSKVALVDDTMLPLSDAAIDRLLLVHSLEHSRHPQAMLEECWRVLAANGRMLVIVPNRASLWAQSDTTPFGHGRPYTKYQALELLKKVGFTVIKHEKALNILPTHSKMLLKASFAFETLGKFMPMPLGGVHVIEVTKQIYRPIAAERRRLIIPSLKTALNSNRETHD